VVEFVQITDCHLFKDDGGKLLGLQTAFSLNAVLDDIATLPAQDLLLATGDLSQDGTPESYQRLRDGVNRFAMPAFWIPGNHDEPALMASELVGGNWSAAKRILVGNWQLILLDSMVPRRVYGKLKRLGSRRAPGDRAAHQPDVRQGPRVAHRPARRGPTARRRSARAQPGRS